MKRVAVVITLSLLAVVPVIAGEWAAKVTSIEGTGKVKRGEAGQPRPARPGMTLQKGDMISSEEESLIEMVYKNGEIVRLGEMSSLIIEESTPQEVKSELVMGRVWVNMKKLTSGRRQFDMSSPTAVASIRGTVFDMKSAVDSSMDVSVYDGRVAVGPSKGLNKRLSGGKKEMIGEPQEVPGPEEVPPPFEVTLEQWKMIVAGQRISVRADGKYATSEFDLQSDIDSFVQKNRFLDSQTGKKK